VHLLLAQTERQTHDTKTLRFQVLDERLLRVKPGQFLTFHWTIDDQRVTRSYTISSSPVHENYVEITPKRMYLFFSMSGPSQASQRKQADRTAGFTLMRHSTRA
jgi:ferredoxin-NADP reductase